VAELLGGFRRQGRCRYDDELVAAEARDHVLRAGRLAQPIGERPDETVAGRVAEVVVDGLQPVQVDEQCRNWTRLPSGQSGVEVCQQCPAIVQSRQIIVLGQVTKLIFGLDAGLDLREQGGDRHQRVEFGRAPVADAELDESEHAGGDLTGQQWNAGHGGGRHVPALLDGALVVLRRLGAKHRRFLEVFGKLEHGIGVGEVDQLERIDLSDVGSRWPLRDQPGGVKSVVVVAKKADVHVKVGHQVG
jgi:hypothetical protein